MNVNEAVKLERYHGYWYEAYGKTFNQTYVPGEGQDIDTKVIIIGEAPGAEEAVRKRPFVGPSGVVLRQLMATAGLFTGWAPEFGPSNCWLTNVCKYRPPRNRTPTEPEIKTLRPILRYEWHSVGRPRIVIPIGSTALFAVTGQRWSVLKTAGRQWTVLSERSGTTFAVWPMIHPAYALRNKEAQPLLERDWERLADWIKKWI